MQAGGVGLYLSNNLEFSRRSDLDISDDGIESCWIELPRTAPKNIVITLCSLRKVNPVTYSRNWKKKSALCYHIYRLRHLQHDEICTLHKNSHLSYATHKNSLIKYSTTSTACCSESTSSQSIINKIFLCVWFLTSEYLHRMGQTEIVTATLKSWPCIPITPSSILFRNGVYSD